MKSLAFWRRKRTASDTEQQTSVSRLRGGFGIEPSSFCWLVLAFILVELVFFLFQYYDVYHYVYPDSRAAQNLSGGKGTAFAFFKWAICWCTGCFTFWGGAYLAFHGIKVAAEEFSVVVAWLVALPWIAICLFVGTWQMWIYWVMMSVWGDSVWNHGCDGWDGYAMLEGIQWMDVSGSLPFVGAATVFAAAGNYSLQLERNARNHNIFYFYDMQSGNMTPPYTNITYDIRNHTYTRDNITEHYTVTPNLAFPSLDLQLDDDSIPFSTDECDMPLANLQYRNGTTTSDILHVVNVQSNDCTKLKVCANMDPKGDFEVAMGVLMIQQFAYGVCCTAPSGQSSSTTIVLSINFGGGSG